MVNMLQVTAAITLKTIYCESLGTDTNRVYVISNTNQNWALYPKYRSHPHESNVHLLDANKRVHESHSPM